MAGIEIQGRDVILFKWAWRSKGWRGQRKKYGTQWDPWHWYWNTKLEKQWERENQKSGDFQ